VEDKRVNRDGAGKKGDPYRYAFSGFLVPDISRERENENPKIEGTPRNDGADSRSHDSALSDSGSRETEVVLWPE
jgi:hypothetical protein